MKKLVIETSLEKEYIEGENEELETNLLIQIKNNTPRTKPTHNIICLDISGSTADSHYGGKDKNSAMKDLLEEIPKFIIDGDKVTLIAFSNTASMISENLPLRKGEIHNLIQHLKPENSTNLYDALRLAYERINDNSQIIIISDGMANTGKINEIGDMTDWVTEKAIRINVIGFGAESNMSGMRKLTQKTGGEARFCLTEDDAQRSLAASLTNKLDVVSKRERIKITPNTNVEIKNETGDVDLHSDGDDLYLDLENIYPQDLRNIMVKVIAKNLDSKKSKFGLVSVNDVQVSIDRIKTEKELVDRRLLTTKCSEMLGEIKQVQTWLKQSNYNDSMTSFAGTMCSYSTNPPIENKRFIGGSIIY